MWATKWWHTASNLSEDCSLETFIKNIKPHPHEQYDSLFYHEVLNEKIDFILRFETIQKDFNTMLNYIGETEIVLPHIEKREHGYYTSLYNDKEKQLVSKLFDIDILKFSYSFDNK
jgi:hypothetical protein